MRFRIALALALPAAALVPPAAAVAQPTQSAPPSVALAADQLQALGAWVKRITDALAPANESSVAFASAAQDFAAGAGRGDIEASLPRLRAANASLREALSRSDALLAQVQPFDRPPSSIPAGVLNRVLTDARAQVAALRQQTADTEALAAAVERGDQAAVQAIAPKLVRSGFLHLRGAAAMYRARQAIVPPDRSPHQMASVTVALYDAMSIAAESWFAARVERRRDAAALQQARFRQLADGLEKDVQTGRSNLDRERAAFASARPRMMEGGAGSVVASADAMSQLVAQALAIGDEIAGLLRARASLTGEELAAQDQPQLLAELSLIEQRYVQHMATAAAAVAQNGR